MTKRNFYVFSILVAAFSAPLAVAQEDAGQIDAIYKLGIANPGNCPLLLGPRIFSDTNLVDSHSSDGLCFYPASSTPPQIAQFGDAKYYVLASPLPFKLGENHDTITIPKGFVTDLASIPRPLWSALPRDGKYMSAAILHDYLYWDQRCTRDEADTILKLEMQEFGVSKSVVTDVYQGVHLFGASSWRQNTKAKNSTIRVIPEDALKQFLSTPLDATQTWESIQAKLKASGVKPAPDSGNASVSEICKRVSGL